MKNQGGGRIIMKSSIRHLFSMAVLLLLAGCAEVAVQEETPLVLPTGAELRTPQLVVQTGHSKEITSLAFSPDGKVLASSSGDETVTLWHSATGKELRSLSGHSRGVAAVAISPDGTLVASGSWDETVKLWHLPTGQELRTFRGHAGWVVAVAFSPDGRLIASGSKDGTVKLWNIATGGEVRTLDNHAQSV
ncbi:hypothetical protein GF339_14495 [candidate division KSB3 bacterium]|uniref:WD40 repeat domain-containing protein n=1 Tax=candidate division KSB3 bacterium TaxID=2044937 RepID=A0A9D5JXJ0_9BACT|nr:hypothetical protein [candidate division KSB3 bacterium]